MGGFGLILAIVFAIFMYNFRKGYEKGGKKDEGKEIITTKNDNQPMEGGIIETDVVGVTFEGRQTRIAELKIGDTVFLTREDNPYDDNAIKVSNEEGESLGFINRELAAVLAPQLNKNMVHSNQRVDGKVTKITGGGTYRIGFVISFTVPTKEDFRTDAEIEIYRMTGY